MECYLQQILCNIIDILYSISVAYLGSIWGGDITKMVFLAPLEIHLDSTNLL